MLGMWWRLRGETIMYIPEKGDIIRIIKIHRKDRSYSGSYYGKNTNSKLMLKIVTGVSLTQNDKEFSYYQFEATEYGVNRTPSKFAFKAVAVENVNTGAHSISSKQAPSWWKRKIHKEY